MVSRLDKRHAKKLESMFEAVNEEDDEVEGRASSEDESSSDDDREWLKEMRNERNKIRNEQRTNRTEDDGKAQQPKFYEIKGGTDFKVSDFNSAEKRETSRYQTLQ